MHSAGTMQATHSCEADTSCCVPWVCVCIYVCSAGELEFLPNKFLVAADGAPDGRAVLVKSYTFDQGSGSDRLLHSKVVAAPKWASPSTDPTHKVGRDGKQRPASSIFQLFKAQGGKYAFNLAGSGKEVQVRSVEGWRVARARN